MNANYMDYLASELDSSSVIFHNFLLEYRKFETQPICFVEGFDDSYYYRNRVEKFTDSKRAKFIPCSGKKGVIGIYNDIKQHEEFDNKKFFFFIDKDFDDEEVSDEIYVTPTYSIENLYTSLDSFKLILEDIFRRPASNEDYHHTVNLFEQRKNEFFNIIKELNICIACDRELKQENRSRVSMSDVNILDYITVNLLEVKSLQKLDELLNFFSHITMEHRERKKVEYSILNKEYYIRGKFEFQFFCGLLTKLAKDSNIRDANKREFFSRRIKTDLNLTSNQLLTLSQFADTPDCLIDYICKVWEAKEPKKVS
ncbi:DUF4435 domain-containing protein [Cytobacillus gottheilii]|uniref:DUF4435 domain-containing protein n=1 Tax=Cytobacillus gottheilii TaxID=859144 RepID=UPI003CE83C12